VTFDVSKVDVPHRDLRRLQGRRPRRPTDFKGQVSLVREVLDALRVPIVTAEGFEADDVIATAGDRRRPPPDMDVLVVPATATPSSWSATA
jgi:DNA polymerase-1